MTKVIESDMTDRTETSATFAAGPESVEPILNGSDQQRFMQRKISDTVALPSFELTHKSGGQQDTAANKPTIDYSGNQNEKSSADKGEEEGSKSGSKKTEYSKVFEQETTISDGIDRMTLSMGKGQLKRSLSERFFEQETSNPDGATGITQDVIDAQRTPNADRKGDGTLERSGSGRTNEPPAEPNDRSESPPIKEEPRPFPPGITPLTETRSAESAVAASDSKTPEAPDKVSKPQPTEADKAIVGDLMEALKVGDLAKFKDILNEKTSKSDAARMLLADKLKEKGIAIGVFDANFGKKDSDGNPVRSEAFFLSISLAESSVAIIAVEQNGTGTRAWNHCLKLPANQAKRVETAPVLEELKRRLAK